MKTLLAMLIVLVPTVALAQDPYAVDAYGNPIPAAAPQGDQYMYGFVGPHPEPYDYGNAPCYQMGAHFHPYPPFDQYLFREENGYFYFIGDLGDFGYSGQLFGYAGNHPIPVEYGGGFCYIDWQHRHHFPAPASMPFRYVGGYYTYYGPWAPGYYTYRNAWAGYYNGYYRNSYYGGRYWSVRPPHVYRPSYGWGSRGVYRPGVTVVGPGGGTITVGPGYHHGGYPARPGYVAPPPGRPVYAPSPGRPVVVAPPSGPGYVAPPPGRPVYAPSPGRPVAAPPPGRPFAPAPGRPVAPPPGPQRRPSGGVLVAPPPG